MVKVCFECKREYPKLHVSSVRYRISGIANELEDILKREIELDKDHLDYERLTFAEMKLFVRPIKENLKAIESKCQHLLKSSVSKERRIKKRR